MPSFIIRKIDQALWDQFKAKAAQEGHALRHVMMSLMGVYARKGRQIWELDDTSPIRFTSPDHDHVWKLEGTDVLRCYCGAIGIPARLHGDKETE